MKIAIEPDAEHWVTVPRFPPPGWARRAASSCLARGSMPGMRCDSLEERFSGLPQWSRSEGLVRLVHVSSSRQSSFVADLALEPADDDGSGDARRSTQLRILDRLIDAGDRQSTTGYRPTPETAGLLATRRARPIGGHRAPQIAIALRMGASLPTAPVDLVVRLWGAPPQTIAEDLDDVSALITTISPLRG
ncbi:hypothetical protein M3T53_07875 [Actinomyces sp. B33]|uniref:hypothetical protein n=1 Tax=Actinomyces sp. B33 TaxID=2942131 RepID=UPI0023414934|nr:hypothetical protein [Actinomyces sp. B33]MDC4233620.1 hypothetical protein [Actinomyces sp. B33]